MIEPLAVLAEDEDLPRWELPAALSRLYGGAIGFDEPCIVANFVESLDGVVAVPGLPRSHALLGDESEPDRFVMALLRACSDAIVIGSGTLASSPSGTWRAGRVYPAAAESLAELRARRGRLDEPLVAVVTSGRTFDPTHPVLESGILVLTTARAEAALRAAVPAASEVVAVDGEDAVHLPAAMATLRERGCSVILSEAGPRLFGGLLAARLVDELFLTVSPLVAGRGEAVVRPGFVEGVALLPETRVAGLLRSVRIHGSHLFLRYGLG